MKLLIPMLLIASSASAEMVNGYVRKDGTYVQPYYRTPADNNPYNNKQAYEESNRQKWERSYPNTVNPYDYVEDTPQPRLQRWSTGLNDDY